jgi:hypothetical protein
MLAVRILASKLKMMLTSIRIHTMLLSMKERNLSKHTLINNKKFKMRENKRKLTMIELLMM